MAVFAQRLNEALSLRNLTPAELSRMTGIGEGAISQYRKGKYEASQRNLEKLSVALRVPVSWLMGADELQAAKEEAAPKVGDGLTDTEQKLLAMFSCLSEDQQLLLLAQIETLLKYQK